MTDPSAIDTATRRLAAALDSLQAAVERRREADRGQNSLSSQLHALSNDRARLAADLDAAAGQTRLVEGTNRDIARRLDVAIESIQSVLDAHDR